MRLASFWGVKLPNLLPVIRYHSKTAAPGSIPEAAPAADIFLKFFRRNFIENV
jgi:hypothetical protein